MITVLELITETLDSQGAARLRNDKEWINKLSTEWLNSLNKGK